jgi:hypothetical protein
MDFKTTKIPKTDYNLVNQRDIEMVDFKSGNQSTEIFHQHEKHLAVQTKKGKCSEEWDCCCFSCDCDI